MLGVHVACASVLLVGRGGSVKPQALAAQLAKLVKAGNAPRAVKLCRAVPGRNPAARLALTLLGQELPASVFTGASTDYRAAPEGSPFAERLRALAEEEVARLRRTIRPWGVLSVASGLGAAAAGIVALVFGRGPWAVGAMTTATVGAIGAILSLSSTRRLLAGPTLVCEHLLPLLRPVEEMRPQDVEAAREARGALAELSEQAFPIAWALVATTAALVGPWVVVGIASTGSPPARETAARVVEIEGAAPVAVGAACRVAVDDVRDDEDLNCRVAVACGDTGLYGTVKGSGFARCLFVLDVAETATDESWTDGDPRLHLDRPGRSVEIRTATWAVRLAMDEPSAAPAKNQTR